MITIPGYSSITPVASAQLPAASAVPTNTVFALTDFRNALVYSDGTIWRPLNGSALLYHKAGSVSAPVSTINSAGGNVQFTLPETLSIPSILLGIGLQVYVSARLKRTTVGAGGVTIVGNCMFGKNNNSVDNGNAINQSINAATNQDWQCEGYFQIATATRITQPQFIQFNSQTTNAIADTTTIFDNSVTNFVNFYMQSTVSGDVIALIDYSVFLRG